MIPNRPFLKRLARSGGFGIAVAWLVLSGSGCATSSQALRLEARNDVAEGRYDDAQARLLRKEILADAKSRVLTLLELGTVATLAGEYEKSNRLLYAAREMVEQLYTKSVSERASTWVLNDTSSTYRGLDYERSLIHYHIVMNFLQIAQGETVPAWELPEIRIAGKLVFAAESHGERKLGARERAETLGRARAEVLAWDTTLETLRTANQGLPIYKDDLLAKILGAYVHQMLGTREDIAAARILYDDAKRILFRSYNLFPTFNEKHSEFGRDFASLPNLPEEEVASRYIASTPASKEVEGLIASAADAVEAPAKGNGLFVLELGIVPAKREKVYTVGLSSLFGQIQDPRLRRSIEEIGVRALLQFAPIVGVGVVSVAVVGAAKGGPNGPSTMSGAVDRAIGFEFKLPEIPRERPVYPRHLRLTPVGNGGKSLEVPLAAVNPIGDFAAQEVDTASAQLAAKTGVRVGLKYLAALTLAYGTYRQLARSSEFAAVLAASAAYMGAKAVIDASEAADTRAWSLLPQSVCAGEAGVPAGEYEVEVVGDGYSDAKLGRISVAPSRRNLFKWRIPRVPQVRSVASAGRS